MTDIFLSYCRKDKEFCSKLKADIEKMSYSVWMDVERIDGGSEWEAEIEQSLEQAKIFIVVISEDSNRSNWVRRETIRAEQLGMTRIPILLNADLPLRLLELQFVDFRGPYQGGFSDLDAVLTKCLGRRNGTSEAIRNEEDRILGSAIRELFDGNAVEADLMMQAAILQRADLGTSTTQFWKTLGNLCNAIPSSSSDAEYCSHHLKVVERSRFLDDRRHVESLAQGPAFVLWSLHLETDVKGLLDRVDRVKYDLHPTFKPPVQVVRDRSSGFRLERRGWGIFRVDVEVFLKDGSSIELEHQLTFEEAGA